MTVFDARKIRIIVQCRGILLDAGFNADNPAVMCLTWIRDRYIFKTKIPMYLSHMLGDIANIPMSDCTLFGENGEQIEGHPSQLLLQYFIRQRFGIDDLPYKVVAKVDDKIEVKYL